MNGEEVIGLLTRSALIRAMMREGPESYVAGAMDRNFVRVPPDMELAKALPQVSRAGSCALVMDGERLQVLTPWRVMPNWADKGMSRSIVTFERSK